MDGYRFVECTTCGFIFCPDIETESGQPLHGSGNPGAGERTPAQGWADDASFLTPVLALAGERTLRILDFGCGSSPVPDLLRDRGHQVVTMDLASPGRADVALPAGAASAAGARREHADAIPGAQPAPGLVDEQFDLVYALQIFEHLPHPRGVLDTLLRLTVPGGLIAIHTDMETEERRALVDWWYVLPPEHCSFYRHRTFERFVAGTPHSLVLGLPRMVVIRKGHPSRALGAGAPTHRRTRYAPETVHAVLSSGCDGWTK